jgi:hypothetical protein
LLRICFVTSYIRILVGCMQYIRLFGGPDLKWPTHQKEGPTKKGNPIILVQTTTTLCLIRMLYQLPASSIFLSEQISHQLPASNIFFLRTNQHQQLAKRTVRNSDLTHSLFIFSQNKSAPATSQTKSP